MNIRSNSDRGFFSDRRGNIALLTAMLTPVILCFAGAAIDFSRWSIQCANLKEVADLLATRGAREFLLANASESNINAVLTTAINNDVGKAYDLGSFTHQISVDTTDAAVTVTLLQRPAPGLILTRFPPYKNDIEITSTAVARGGSNVCVVILEEADSDAVLAAGTAQLNAPDCAVMSNSTSPNGVSAVNAASISADIICSAGGYSGGINNFNPMPTTDCPPYQDPLAERVPPSSSGCDYRGKYIGNRKRAFSRAQQAQMASTVANMNGQFPGTLPGYARHDLSPGVYCGGLVIADPTADVHFAPGIYIIKNGVFRVGRGARIFGDGVGFYLDGKATSFSFEESSIIHLVAPETGPMAGLLFWEGDAVNPGMTHRIRSANARELLGTIYLKAGTLLVDSKRPIADASAYTAIVANKLEMKGHPTLELNADYAATTVPAPTGVGPVGGATYLRE